MYCTEAKAVQVNVDRDRDGIGTVFVCVFEDDGGVLAEHSGRV